LGLSRLLQVMLLLNSHVRTRTTAQRDFGSNMLFYLAVPSHIVMFCVLIVSPVAK
jgi:hypothetical protein